LRTTFIVAHNHKPNKNHIYNAHGIYTTFTRLFQHLRIYSIGHILFCDLKNRAPSFVIT